jgi:hypothetical protein
LVGDESLSVKARRCRGGHAANGDVALVGQQMGVAQDLLHATATPLDVKMVADNDNARAVLTAQLLIVQSQKSESGRTVMAGDSE